MSASILLPLSIVPIFLPIFSGYFLGVIFLIWISTSGEWRNLFRYFLCSSSDCPSDYNEDSKLSFYKMSRGLIYLFICFFISMILAQFFSDFSKTWSKAVSSFFHLFLKHFLLWFALAGGVVVLYVKGKKPSSLARWFILVLAIHLVYVMVQRYTGIDLVHGFSAKLPPNRFAYGIYRVSGFMSHPLTLAYNLGLVMLTALYFVLSSVEYRKGWVAVLALAFLNMLLTGSRWPLAAFILTCGIVLGLEMLRSSGWVKQIYRFKIWILLSLVIVVVGIWFEGSIVSRIYEVFDPNIPLTTRFPRLVFWQVHWQMFLDHPIFGVGLPGMEQAIETYYQAFPMVEEKYSAHNIFLQTMADFGVIGLGGFLVFLYYMYQSAKGVNGLGVKLFLVATVAFGLFQNTLRDSEYLFAFWLLISFILIDTSKE